MSDFQQFFQDMQSGYWWLSVVIIRLILGVLGNAIYKGGEVLLSKFIEKQRRRLEKRKKQKQEEDEKLMSALIENPDRLYWQQIKTSIFYTGAFIAGVCSILLFLLIFISLDLLPFKSHFYITLFVILFALIARDMFNQAARYEAIIIQIIQQK